MSTLIQWTDQTDNIIVAEGGGWWCRMISPGCAHCYAAKLNQSTYFGGNKLPYTGAPPKLKLRTEILDGWQRQTKPKRHFVASMTDIFGDWVPEAWIFQFLGAMANAPRQTFQMLTKRADIAERMINNWLIAVERYELPDNMWIGTSIENQDYALRADHLRRIPAAVRFLSLEPLLGPVTLDLNGIHWVIVGGESGPGARPCDVEWIRSIIGQCADVEVPCFVKQLGRDPQWPQEDIDQKWYEKMTHAKGGEITEWPMDLRVRQFPQQ